MSQENVEIVNRINATADLDLVQLVRDPDLAAASTAAIARFLHRQFECVRHDVPGGKPYIGIDGFQEWWQDWLAPWVEYRTKINELIDCGERVLTLQHSFGRLEGSTHEVTLDLATLWTFRDGKVARWEVYPSHVAALKAVGLEE